MKRILVAGAAAAFLGLSGPATAADYPVKGPIAAALFNWSGFYVGANAGLARERVNITGFVDPTSNMNAAARALEAVIDNGRVSDSAFTAGLQAGYNWQTGNFVIGLETDLNWLGLKATRNTGLVTVGAFTGQTIDTVSSDWLFTFRPRVGVAFDRLLAYVTGGLAVVHRKFSHSQSWNFVDGCPPVGGGQQLCHVGSTSKTSATWTAGFGGEYALTNNITMKIEYLYVAGTTLSFTSVNAGPAIGATQPVVHRARFSHIDIFRLGLNWKM